jgi:predicted dehydrogenase
VCPRTLFDFLLTTVAKVSAMARPTNQTKGELRVMKKYKVGVVGYGWVASAHIPAINASTLGEVVAVCSARPMNGGELSARHGGKIAVYQDLDQMLANPEINVISLCSLPDLHVQQAQRAAEAGKHLIIEKPLCLSSRDLRVLMRAVNQSKVRVCVCFECRFSNQFVATKSVIDQGLLGDLHYGEIDYYHGIGPWYGQFRWNIRRNQGGSALLSAGCHALDALRLCMGSEVVEVTSYATRSGSKLFRAYEYPSTSVTLLKFKNGSVGKCAASLDCLQPYYFHTHLVGSKGSLLDNKFYSSDLGTDKAHWNTLSLKMLDSGDVADHPYQTQFQAFFEALEEGRDMPLTNLAEAAKTHEVIFAADLSAKTGRPVKIRESGR